MTPEEIREHVKECEAPKGCCIVCDIFYAAQAEASEEADLFRCPHCGKWSMEDEIERPAGEARNLKRLRSNLLKPDHSK